MPQSAKRERLVTTALGLFAEHGFHATGIDQIVEAARKYGRIVQTGTQSRSSVGIASFEAHLFAIGGAGLTGASSAFETYRE